jgi:hypothetical protein
MNHPHPNQEVNGMAEFSASRQQHKKCVKCGHDKPLSDYTFPHAREASYCRGCRIQIKREDRYRHGAEPIEQRRARAAARKAEQEKQRAARRARRPPGSIPIGKRYQKEYFAWNDMKKRCLNPRHPKYPCYGGRGISICALWRNSFPAFLNDVGPCPDKRLSIDRINNDGNYEPGNVRWATSEQQHASQRHKPRRTRNVA